MHGTTPGAPSFPHYATPHTDVLLRAANAIGVFVQFLVFAVTVPLDSLQLLSIDSLATMTIPLAVGVNKTFDGLRLNYDFDLEVCSTVGQYLSVLCSLCPVRKGTGSQSVVVCVG